MKKTTVFSCVVNRDLSLKEMIAAGRYGWANRYSMLTASGSKGVARRRRVSSSSTSTATSSPVRLWRSWKSAACVRPTSRNCSPSALRSLRNSGSTPSWNSVPWWRLGAVATRRTSTCATPSGPFLSGGPTTGLKTVVSSLFATNFPGYFSVIVLY